MTEPPRTSTFVRKKLRELDAALLVTVPRVMSEPDDDAIHDMRVAIRRLRTLLEISRTVFGRWHTDAVRSAFADVMRATGELRDEEVLRETLEGASSAPGFARWVKHRQTRETRLRAAVVRRLTRGELDRARLMLKALLVFPVDPDRDTPLGRFARKTVDRARRRVEKRRDVEPDDAEGLHELRIAYKKLRYAIELLEEALPIDARALLEPAVVFQKRLGEVHDADVAIEAIRAGDPAARGALTEEVRQEALASLEALRKKRIGKYLRELDPLAVASADGAKSAAETKGDAEGEGDARPENRRDEGST